MIRTVASSKVMWGHNKKKRARRSLSFFLLAVLVAALVLVAGPASAATLFSNPTPIKIPSSGISGSAAPYPSEIAVSGLTGPITNVAVTLYRVGHTRPADMDILLVSPSGDDVMLMSDACGEDDIEDFTWIFSQQAPRAMSSDSSDCGEITYRPTNYDSADTMLLPAPAGPYGTNLDTFNNENPNGTWKLYIMDDGLGGDVGDIEGGWALSIETRPVDVAIPGSGTSGPASPYPATRTVSGVAGGITDLNVTIDGIWHQSPDDLDLLLVGPTGRKVVLMSDACGPLGVNAYGWVWDDEAPAPMPEGNGTDVCGTRFHRPANHGPGDVWPAPAPAGPYSTSLSAFDFTDPNGEWRLFVNDDMTANTGFFTNRFQLQITTDATAPTVTSVSPANNATGIAPSANVTATFSEAMDAITTDGDASTVNATTFKLVRLNADGTTTKVTAAVSYDAATKKKKAILDPSSNLSSGRTYKATVTTGAQDLAGNALDQNPNVAGNQNKSWKFTVQ